MKTIWLDLQGARRVGIEVHLGRCRDVRLMAANRNRRFDEPIKLPGGGKLFTLKHAIAWLAKEIPQ